MKAMKIFLSLFLLCGLNICEASHVADQNFVDITPKADYGQIIDAGFLPPKYNTIYWISRKDGVNHIYTYDLSDHLVTEILKEFSKTESFDNLDWAPDGEKLLYTENGNISVLTLSTGQSVKLTSSQDVSGSHPLWVDDSQIAYTAPDTSRNGNSLYAISLDNRKSRLIIHPDFGLIVLRGYTLNTRRLIYSVGTIDKSNTYSASLSGDSLDNVEMLKLPKLRTEGIFSASADGRYSVLTGTPISSKFVKSHKVFFINLMTGALRDLEIGSAWNSNFSYLSPDGNWVLVLANPVKELSDPEYGTVIPLELHLLLLSIEKNPLPNKN